MSQTFGNIIVQSVLIALNAIVFYLSNFENSTYNNGFYVNV